MLDTDKSSQPDRRSDETAGIWEASNPSTPIESDDERTAASTPTPAICSPLAFWIGFLASLVLIAVLWGFVTSDKEPARQRNSETPILFLDINDATEAEWALMPGVGPVLAERIVRDRRDHGAFHTIDELARVPGIGEKTIARIRPYCLNGTDRHTDALPAD